MCIIVGQEASLLKVTNFRPVVKICPLRLKSTFGYLWVLAMGGVSSLCEAEVVL